MDSKYADLMKVVGRESPFRSLDPESETRLKEAKILVVGAGGLGCDLLKNLACIGFRDIHVVDMDHIDVSNLNRQFLFREKDVGKPKAEVAADFVNRRVPSCHVTPHVCRVEMLEKRFFMQFRVIVSGLDAIPPRKYCNSLAASLPDTYFVDGGSTGFKGNAMVIIPGVTPCLECVSHLYPQGGVHYNLCTIQSTPRIPEHCVMYAMLILWEKAHGKVAFDGDSVEDVIWMQERAIEHAKQHNIPHAPITFQFAQGVMKNIIPAIATTNSVIASSCANEVFKIVTETAPPLTHFMMFNGEEQICCSALEMWKNEECVVCGEDVQLSVKKTDKMEEILRKLMETFQLASDRLPSIIIGDKLIYTWVSDSMRDAFEENLKRPITYFMADGDDVEGGVIVGVTHPDLAHRGRKVRLLLE